jgi:Na+-transporting methylmalonyl-CoA/oxaloacetate decarboxylase gamma subunit
MDDQLVTSLVVTGVGMLILFLALAFLYGLLYLMTALIKDQPPAPGPSASEDAHSAVPGRAGEEPRQGEKLRAAVIAIALARAEQELGTTSAPGVEEADSAWRTLHHQRQLTRNLRARRDR